MTKTYSYDYEIEALGVHLEHQGKNNVVYEIRGYITVTETTKLDGAELSCTKKKYFVVPIPYGFTEFIQYENLTKQIIVEWIQNHEPKGQTQNFKEELLKEFNPTQIYMKPPF